MNSGEKTAGSLRAVRSRIVAAAARSARSPDEVALLAVTKTVPVSRIREAVAAGQVLFGENRVQEARDKVEALGRGINWHMIGHLQKNKAKAAVMLFDTVESVDSADLAVAIDRHAAAAGKIVGVLVQVKEAAEQTKSGISPGEAPALIETIQSLPNLDLQGLMTVPPWPEDPEDSRPYFVSLRRLRDEWDGHYCPAETLRELSMGMTVDFEVAVEEGATIVRVGSAVFGARPYPNPDYS